MRKNPEVFDGPAGIKITCYWETEGADRHHLVMEFPEDMSEEDRIYYQDALNICLLEEGVNPFIDSFKDRL